MLENPIEMWEQRHARLDTWRSGGDRGLSPEENYEFYAYRLGRVIELIRRHAGAERPLRVLDAGCGRGHFTDGLRRCGHLVTGIDSSPTAISRAREAYGPPFVECRLDDHRPAALYDVIVCIDVLFHVLSDEAWQAAATAFGRYASAESAIILTDTLGDETFTLGDYIVHRPLAQYQRALAPADFELVELTPYDFGSNPNRFGSFRRRL